MKRINSFYINIFALLIMTLGHSCQKFVEVEPPRNSIAQIQVFSSNELATSAILGVYERMAAGDFASGNLRSISTLAGLAADEFIGYNGDNIQIQNNLILPDNPTASSLWISIYARIYGVNGILEGLEANNSVTPQTKNLLRGEAFFCRAFAYFYLVNLYGAVPLQLNTDYLTNMKAVRMPVPDIYAQIIKDLEVAISLLPTGYTGSGRTRPNQSTAYALLARVYLYLSRWDEAEKYSSLVIENSAYRILTLDQVFLNGSQEAIWQLYPPAGGNTLAGNLLILTTTPSASQVSLSSDFVNTAFEANDLRKASWTKNVSVTNVTYHYPFKYKVRANTAVTESTMVFRLAEQHLIRAEARVKLNDLAGGISDLDLLRKRAGLPLIKDTNPGISAEALLTAIFRERRVELFSEWGDRWFDLKRRNELTGVLAPIKQNWKPEYTVFPIPKVELDGNSNVNQNPEY